MMAAGCCYCRSMLCIQLVGGDGGGVRKFMCDKHHYVSGLATQITDRYTHSTLV